MAHSRKDVNDSELNRTFYFLPLTEFEFLLMAGLSQVVKNNTGGKTVLLHTSHPRIKDKMQEYYGQFDEVMQLPYCRYRRNLFRGYQDFKTTWSRISQLTFDSDRVLFNSSGRQLINMMVLHHFKKMRGQTKSVFAQLLPYPENKNEMVVSIPKSALMNAYSLLLRRMVFYHYEVEQPSYYGYISRPDWDARLYVEHDGTPVSEKFFQRAPSTLEFIDRSKASLEKCAQLDKPGVLVLVDSMVPDQHGLSQEHYWDVIRDLVDYIKQNFELKIYIKMHPNSDIGELDKYSVRATVLDPQIAAEEYYISGRENLLAVFSTASTALLTAQWLGIAAFSICEMVGYSGAIYQRFLTYLAPCSGIVHLKRMEDLNTIKFEKPIEIPETCFRKETAWRDILKELESLG